jgi:hypothetical protein
MTMNAKNPIVRAFMTATHAEQHEWVSYFHAAEKEATKSKSVDWHRNNIRLAIFRAIEALPPDEWDSLSDRVQDDLRHARRCAERVRDEVLEALHDELSSSNP